MGALRLALLSLALLALSARAAATTVLGEGQQYTVSLSANQRAQIAASLQAAQQAGTALTAALAGDGGAYGDDTTGSGSVSVSMYNDTRMDLMITVQNMEGPMPPFKSYIRIGAGPYQNRIVIGVPDAEWATLAKPLRYQLYLYINEDDLFPRIPGFTLKELFDFLWAAPEQFFVSVHTVEHIKGAVRGVLQGSQ